MNELIATVETHKGHSHSQFAGFSEAELPMAEDGRLPWPTDVT
jgi:uncharacterized protein (UPF0210 family)